MNSLVWSGPYIQNLEKGSIMPEVSLTRLYALRAMYLILFALVPLMTAAAMVYSARSFSAADGWGFTACLLAALSLLAALGLRYPLKMLPLLMFEFLWKIIWLARVALPLWRAGRIDEALVSNSIAAGLAVLVLIVIPWRYVAAQYLLASGDPWRRPSSVGVARPGRLKPVG